MDETPYLLDDSRIGALISLLCDSLGNYHNSILTTTVRWKLPHLGKTGPESFTSKRLIFFYVRTFSKVFLSFSLANDIKYKLI